MKLEHFNNLKDNLKEDFRLFCSKFNFINFINNWKIIILFFILSIFLPFILFFVINLYIYKYLIKYLFILFDILILDFIGFIIKSNVMIEGYLKIKYYLWLIFYRLVFEYCPKLFWWVLDKFTVNFWLDSLSTIYYFSLLVVLELLIILLTEVLLLKFF
jgi:hypothetical protein